MMMMLLWICICRRDGGREDVQIIKIKTREREYRKTSGAEPNVSTSQSAINDDYDDDGLLMIKMTIQFLSIHFKLS